MLATRRVPPPVVAEHDQPRGLAVIRLLDRCVHLKIVIGYRAISGLRLKRLVTGEPILATDHANFAPVGEIVTIEVTSTGETYLDR
jgi:hypothetical protein